MERRDWSNEDRFWNDPAVAGTLAAKLGGDEGQPRALTDNVSLPAEAAPRQFGAQDIQVVTLSANVPLTVNAPVRTQFVDIVCEVADCYANIGGYVAATAGVPVHYDANSVKLGMQGQTQITLISAGAARVYLVFNDQTARVFGGG